MFWTPVFGDFPACFIFGVPLVELKGDGADLTNPDLDFFLFLVGFQRFFGPFLGLFLGDQGFIFRNLIIELFYFWVWGDGNSF